MSLAKLVKVFLIGIALLTIAQGRPLDDWSSEDDRLNAISEEYGRRVIVPDVDRIFNSAEIQDLRRSSKSTNKIKRQGGEMTRSSKHAHGMITSMLSFVSNVFNFGRTLMRNERYISMSN